MSYEASLRRATKVAVPDSHRKPRLGNLSRGGVSERPKERASKAREGKTSESSNLSATATLTRQNAGPRPRRGSALGCLVSVLVSFALGGGRLP